LSAVFFGNNYLAIFLLFNHFRPKKPERLYYKENLDFDLKVCFREIIGLYPLAPHPLDLIFTNYLVNGHMKKEALRH